MKLILALVMILGVLTSIINASELPDDWTCNYGKEYKKTREHKKKAAAFYKKLMDQRPSIITFFLTAIDQELTPEELISIIDKKGNCLLD